MKWYKFLILIVVLHMQHFDAAPFAENESIADLDDEDSIRLPASTRPINYDIELSVNIQDFAPYTGTVTITIIVDEATDVITLHSKALQVKTVNVLDSLSEEIPSTYVLDATKDFLIVTIGGRSLIVGDKYTLEISFEGSISSTTQLGFYRTSYRDIVTNETR
jgi:aminopeptidase N